MGFGLIIHNSSTGPVTVLIIITVPVCIGLTILRFISTRLACRKIGPEDWFALAALVAFLAYAIVSLVAVIIDGGRSIEDMTLSDATMISKLGYVVGPFFVWNQLFAKASLFALYYRLFSVNTAFVRITAVLAFIQIGWTVSIFFSFVFLCTPVSKWWDVLGTQPGYCLDYNPFLGAKEIINSLIDFALVGLAVWMVRGLQVANSTKWRLYVLFALGGFTGIIGFIKIAVVYNDENGTGESSSSSPNAFWDMLQQATSILCCCIPDIYRGMRGMLPKSGFWTRFLSRTTSYRSRYGSTTPGAGVSDSQGQQNWRKLDGGGSSRGAVWAGAEAGQSNQDIRHAPDAYPMRTVKIQQTVHMV